MSETIYRVNTDRQSVDNRTAVRRVHLVVQTWSRDPKKFAAALEIAPGIPYERLMTIVAAAAFRGAWNEALRDPALANLSDDQATAGICAALLEMDDAEWANWFAGSREAVKELNDNWSSLQQDWDSR